MPSNESPVRAAIVGCGNIATRYAEQILAYENVHLAGFSDIAPDRAETFAEKYGGRCYPDLQSVLDDTAVNLVVNLTIHHAHAEVITRCLKAGKHVHTEKPLAMSYAEARRLVALADKRNLRLSSAPITYMGEAQQTAWQRIRNGDLGTVRLVYAEVNHGRIETWHPNPDAFYEVGVLWDVAVYPLTLLTAFFGPAESVRSYGRVIYPHRVTTEGRKFTIKAPDLVLAAIEFPGGPVVRLTANFYAKGSKQGGSLEFHGDRGSLYLGNFQSFNAPVEFALYGEPLAPAPHLRPPFEGVEFARGVEDLATAIAEGRPHRASGAHAAHVVEIAEGIQTGICTGETVRFKSTFTPPPPMPWAH